MCHSNVRVGGDPKGETLGISHESHAWIIQDEGGHEVGSLIISATAPELSGSRKAVFVRYARFGGCVEKRFFSNCSVEADTLLATGITMEIGDNEFLVSIFIPDIHWGNPGGWLASASFLVGARRREQTSAELAWRATRSLRAFPS